MNNIDEFEINDSTGPKGFVIIKDTKTGEILVKKHNMIVKTGKEFLLNFLLQNSGSETPTTTVCTTYNNTYKDYRLNKYAFGACTAETTYDFTKDDFNKVNNTHTEPSYKDIILEGGSSGGATSNMIVSSGSGYDSSTVLTGHPYLKFVFQETGDQRLDYVSELGLFLSKGDDNPEYELFSRIVFDPIPYGANTNFTISYYIYF